MTQWDIEEEPISASKMKTFDRCPMQFKLKYVQRNQSLAHDPYYLDIGNAVHYTLEEELQMLLSMKGQGVKLTRPKGDLKTSMLSRLGNVLEGKMDYAEPDPRQEFPIELDDDQRETVVGCIDTAAKWLSKRQPTIRGVESEVDCRINRPDIDAPLMGYMDLATGGSDDANEVVDWKTGKSDGKEMDEALQGAIYMVGYYNLYDVPPDAIKFVYLKEGKVREIEPSDDLYHQMLGRARSLVEANEAGEFPAQPDSSTCNWCEFEAYCPASPAGAGNVDWESYP